MNLPIKTEIQEFESLHRFKCSVLDVRYAIISEVYSLDEQEVAEECSVYTRKTVVPKPHNLH